MRIYLDNNATTALDPKVLQTLYDLQAEVFGNASSIHKEGQTARRILEESRDSVALSLHATPREIVFTSGGSESNNAAIEGAVRAAGRKTHFVTTTIEHPSVLEAVNALELQGHEVSRVRCDERGLVRATDMIAAVRTDTSLVSMMYANNETGVVQPAEEVGRFCRERAVHFHCDAVQAAGKLPVDVEAIFADTLSISAHKIHGPKGVGALFVRRGLALHPLIVGGAQERRRRAGTESVPLAGAFARALEIAVEPSNQETMTGLRDWFEISVLTRISEVGVNGAGVTRLANTSNLRFVGCDADGIVIALDLSGVAVSTGSACASGRIEPSRVLLEMGLTEQDAKSSVRFSLSRFTTSDQLERVVALLGQIVPKNRRETGVPVEIS